MDRLFGFVMVLLIGLVASPSVKPAKANWRSSYDTPTSGYCASARPGQPVSHYLAKDPRFCPENQKSGTVRQKTPKSTPVKKPKTAPVETKRTPVEKSENTPVEKPKSCSVTPFRYHYHNETVQVSVNVKVGERCVLGLKPSPGASIGALKIIAQPRNGDIQSLEGFRVAYTPRSGFKGNDHFIRRVCGDSNLEGTNCSNIEYAVTVY
jgi:hypothetical protein